MRPAIGLLALVLVAPVFVGCLAGDQGPPPQALDPAEPLPDPVRILEDPAGDARAYDPMVARQAAVAACESSEEPVREPCLEAVGAGSAASTDAGAGGPPELDILGVTFQETPEDLVIDLELAEVDPTFADVLPVPGGQLEYGVCWDTANATCNVAAATSSTLLWPQNPFLIVHMTEEGPELMFEQFFTQDPACGGDGTCRTAIPVELIAGSPGVVRFTVPRGALTAELVGGALEGIHAYVYHSHAPMDPLVRLDAGLGPGEATPTMATYSLADITSKAEAFEFLTPRAPDPDPDPGPHHVPDRAGEPRVGTPEGDLLALTVHERPDTFTFATQLAQVAEDSFDHTFLLTAGVWGGGEVQVRRQVEDGRATTTALACPPEGCDRRLPVPVDVEVVTGAPGWLNVTIDRGDLSRPERGDRFSEVFALLEASDANETGGGPVSGEVSELTSLDFLTLPLLPPMALDSPGLGSGSTATAGVAQDDVGDVALNPAIPAQDRANYDVRLVEAAAVSPGTIGLTVALEQLTATPVPTGYDAVVYAAGLQTEAETVMAYFVKPRDGPGEAFCAQDTLAFGNEPSDPTIAIGTPIEAVVNAVSAQDGGRAATSGGSITLLAPAACFGAAPEAPLEVQRMAGGTYLLREVPNLENRVDEVDRSQDSEGFTIEPLSVATAQPAFWQQPFGIENFWDITGLVLALFTVAGTALLVLRRRRAMRRYLSEIARIEELHADDPAGRAEALVALRDRLRRDLHKHRISENHYPIVADRLRGRLTSARINSLGDAFFELPGSLSRRIERLLDDGQLSREDHRALVPMLERAAVEPETRQRVAVRLDTWVQEDARSA